MLAGDERIRRMKDFPEIEVRICTTGSGSKFPAAERIFVDLLAATWKLVGKQVTQIF